MKVAILGASCFGMNLAHHLVFQCNEVLMISRSPMRSKPFTYGLEDYIDGTFNSKPQPFRYEQAHLVKELPKVMTILDVYRPDLVINFAALCEVSLSWNNALDYYETNLMSLVRLTNELSIRSWFKKFVQIGSSEVYGSVKVPATEDSPVSPSSPYANSKSVFDFHLRAIAKHQAFPAVIVMPSNGYCEGQTLNRIIPKTIIAALSGKKILLQGGGVAEKSYLHADDISRAILLVSSSGQLGETYNVGPLQPLPIKTIVWLLCSMLGKNVEDVVDVGPERLGQDSRYWLDSSKIKSLGWKQEVSLTEGFLRMIAWVKKYPELMTMDQTYTHKP